MYAVNAYLLVYNMHIRVEKLNRPYIYSESMYMQHHGIYHSNLASKKRLQTMDILLCLRFYSKPLTRQLGSFFFVCVVKIFMVLEYSTHSLIFSLLVQTDIMQMDTQKTIAALDNGLKLPTLRSNLFITYSQSM